MNKINNDLRAMNVEELVKYLHSMRAELFGLRLNGATTHIKDYSQFSKIKKNIARALTFLQKKYEQHG